MLQRQEPCGQFTSDSLAYATASSYSSNRVYVDKIKVCPWSRTAVSILFQMCFLTPHTARKGRLRQLTSG